MPQSTPEFDNTYARLPDRFFSRVSPEEVPAPETIRVNAALANQLGFDPDWLATDEGAEFAVGNHVVSGSDPIATVYAGHQFGGWVPQLGDGRAVLLGEVLDTDGQRFDVQLKGSGRTPYSRRGDGRAPLGPVLREYLISEAMHALGIPTSRSLVAAATGAAVRREEMLPGGVLVRVARSHIRIGTFQYFAGRGDADGLDTLVRYVIDRHYPELETGADPALDLLAAYAQRLSRLIAQWQLVGFIHGVMNTDNMLLSGETIDYGPCAFMNVYDPETVFSSIDRHGRYAFGNQPRIGQWNLSKLAEALLAAGETDDERIARAQAIVDGFPELFRSAYGEGMARKLGLDELDEDGWELIEDLLNQMFASKADYTLTLRRLALSLAPDEQAGEPVGALDAGLQDWAEKWRSMLGSDDDAELSRRLLGLNPVVIPRNHRVEEALEAAVSGGDLTPFHDLCDAVTRPFDFPEDPGYAEPPQPHEEIVATFCGT